MELVAVLPLVAALLAALGQLALVGEAAWGVAGGARAAARAEAVGVDPAAAARSVLPARLERGLRVRSVGGGEVAVTVRVPPAFGIRIGSVSSRARFAPQR